ncbi:MAG: hypothetical protein EA407_08385 [Rhodobacteraceae bacterium]|nr:MAG: hypothetical protein EA407_08385 [Paracoccaceae bacterium]
MWFLFAMVAAAAALSMTDMLVSSDDGDGEVDSEENDDAEAESSPATGSLLLDLENDRSPPVTAPTDAIAETDLNESEALIEPYDDEPVVEYLDPTAPAQGSGSGGSNPTPPEDPDAGLYDNLGERIHSSDAYPPASAPEPGVQIGTDGDDRLVGSGAGDTLIGGAGNDTLIGNGGDTVLIAESGDNHLIGGEGNDRLIGGSGNDTLEGGWGDDLLIAGGGANVLMGGAGDDTLVGAKLDDTGRDISGANFLNGGAGDDLLITGQGDMLHGGEGADVFALGDWLAGAAPATILDYNPHQDQITLHYDPERLAAPVVTVGFDASDPATARIQLDGQIVAFVVSAPDLVAEDIALVAELPTEILAAE